MRKGWKSLFDPKIRKIARECAYENEYVTDYEFNEKGHSASVGNGTKYKVLISEDYQNMRCGCLHAKGGNRCKHMAAVLYYAEEYERFKKDKEEEEKEREKQRQLREYVLALKKLEGKDYNNIYADYVTPVEEWKGAVKDFMALHNEVSKHMDFWHFPGMLDTLIDFFENLYRLFAICEDAEAIKCSVWLYDNIHSLFKQGEKTITQLNFDMEMLLFWSEVQDSSKANNTKLKTLLEKCKYKTPPSLIMLQRLS